MLPTQRLSGLESGRRHQCLPLLDMTRCKTGAQARRDSGAWGTGSAAGWEASRVESEGPRLRGVLPGLCDLLWASVSASAGVACMSPGLLPHIRFFLLPCGPFISP